MTTTSRGMRARWSRLASTGFILITVAPLIQITAILAFGSNASDVLPFLVPPLVVGTFGVALVRRSKGWPMRLTAFLGLMMGLFASFGVVNLTLLTSFFDFVPELLLLGGSVLVMVSSIAARRARRRGNLEVAPVRSEARAVSAVLAVALAAAVISGVSDLATHSNASSAGAAAISKMKNSKFVPTSYRVAGGSTVFVRNDDPIAHTFTVEALGIDVKFGPKDSKVISVPSKPGTYVFYCTYHTDKTKSPTKNDMAGTVTITGP